MQMLSLRRVATGSPRCRASFKSARLRFALQSVCELVNNVLDALKDREEANLPAKDIRNESVELL